MNAEAEFAPFCQNRPNRTAGRGYHVLAGTLSVFKTPETELF
jgi:hypothetical protein